MCIKAILAFFYKFYGIGDWEGYDQALQSVRHYTYNALQQTSSGTWTTIEIDESDEMSAFFVTPERTDWVAHMVPDSKRGTICTRGLGVYIVIKQPYLDNKENI